MGNYLGGWDGGVIMADGYGGSEAAILFLILILLILSTMGYY